MHSMSSGLTLRTSVQQFLLARLFERYLQLEGHVEVVFDGRLWRPVTKIISRTPAA